MRVTDRQYAAIRHRMRARALAEEAESHTRAARRLGSILGFDDDAKHVTEAAPVVSVAEEVAA